jgi:hypothetical protein
MILIDSVRENLQMSTCSVCRCSRKLTCPPFTRNLRRVSYFQNSFLNSFSFDFRSTRSKNAVFQEIRVTDASLRREIKCLKPFVE